MKQTILLSLLLVIILVVAGCSSQSTTNLPEEVPENTAADTNNNDVQDIQVEADEVTEVTIDFDDVQEQQVQAEIEASLNEDFCIPGETYYGYNDGENDVDAKIIGLTTYKGDEFCQAETITTISTNNINITTNTTYYFDNLYEEFWIISIITNSMLPEPTVSEIHLVNGEIQN
jgi:hypothetical protein